MKTQELELLRHISTNPEIFNGRPVIRGMRFKVADLLGYLASGMTDTEILNDFPYLQQEDIMACLLYASKKSDHTILTVCLDAA